MSWLHRFRRLGRDRLVQFALIGGGLYALSSRGITGAEERTKVIEMDPAALAVLREAQAKRLGVPTLAEESKREVDARTIEDEILYREALRLELDRGDPIVKQRLVQKLLLLVEDMGGASGEPSREELVAAYEASPPDRWRTPERLSLVHVFAARPESLPPASALAGATTPPELGEAFPYLRSTTSSRDELARLFGAEFADGVASLRAGDVSEPLSSSFGWHRVRLVARIEGARAPFEEVRQDVLLEYLMHRRERVVSAFMSHTVATYNIRIGGKELLGFVPTRRVAVRTEGSAED